MNDRWAIYVDLEGFGSKWNETDMVAFRGINNLMEGIFRIGARCYPEPPKRLFAHQFGDAFFVVSDFHEALLDRAALVAIALMRHLLSVGEVAKCTMDEGEISDVANCYPDAIRKQYAKGRIGMAAGLMTITPVMGTALIRTAALQKKVPGPLFLMREALADRLSSGFDLRPVQGGDLVSLNWVRGQPPGLSELQGAAELAESSEQTRLGQLRKYLELNPGLHKEWIENAEKHLLTSGT